MACVWPIRSNSIELLLFGQTQLAFLQLNRTDASFKFVLVTDTSKNDVSLSQDDVSQYHCYGYALLSE